MGRSLRGALFIADLVWRHEAPREKKNKVIDQPEGK